LTRAESTQLLPLGEAPIGASWWHVAAWAIFGPLLSLLPFALAVGESPLAYLAGVGSWLAVLAIAVRRTRSWRHAVSVRDAQIVEGALARQAAWDLPEARADRARAARDKAARGEAEKLAEERQFAIWDQEKAAEVEQTAMRKRYEARHKKP
jgi:hypothetical protein